MRKFPDWSIDRLSLAKVEKVVNPPQKPVVKSRQRLLEVEENLENSPYSRPIRRQPAILTMNVDSGNPPDGLTSRDTT